MANWAIMSIDWTIANWFNIATGGTSNPLKYAANASHAFCNQLQIGSYVDGRAVAGKRAIIRLGQ